MIHNYTAKFFKFASQIKFLDPKVIPYSLESNSTFQAPVDTILEPLYVNIYDSKSANISQQLHRLKVESIKKGGQEFIYSETKVGLAVGLKDKPYETGANSCRQARARGFSNLIFLDNEQINTTQFAKILSGFILANYRFKIQGTQTNQKEVEDSTKGVHTQIQQIYLQEKIYQDPIVQQELKMAYYKQYTRELANLRQAGTTKFFYDEVMGLFKDNSNVKITTFVGDQLLENGLNLLHAVGKGSKQEPMMINLTYQGNPLDSTLHSLVGKGIVFDTGGYHLKPYGGMEKMFLDKSGASSVLAAFRGAVEMRLKVNVTATIGLAENAIGNESYRPADIIVSHKGLTVEINNTDAEGRLVLADCISWTLKERNPNKIIEISTLTGACWAALGDNTAGIFSNNDELCKEITEIGESVQEAFWRLPVTSEHFELMKGDNSDLCNVGKGKTAGAQRAAAFLMSFLDEEKNIPFAHLDIAGPMEAKSNKGINSVGATGFGTFTLLKYLINNQKYE